MLLLFIICCENVDCDIYNVLYCLYIECKINLSIYLTVVTLVCHCQKLAIHLSVHVILKIKGAVDCLKRIPKYILPMTLLLDH